MTKKIIISFGLIIAIIGCSVLFVVVYKAVKGNGIEHFKQFFFRCQGQINFYEGDKAEINFYFIDEEELSEMGSPENILAVNLITDDGTVLSAESWEIKNSGRGYLGDEFFKKTLQINIIADETFTITKIDIVYPDTTEQFDIGSLKINVIEKSDFVMGYVQIQYFLFNFETDRYTPGVTEYSLSAIDPFVYINVQAPGWKEYEITEIDFNIPGFGIDAATIKEYNPEVISTNAFREYFTNNSEYNVYLKPQSVDVLPSQNFNLLISGYNAVNRIMSICITPEYDNDLLTMKYLSPLFTCVETETEKEYQYFNTYNFLSTQFIYNDDLMQLILEEYGV